MRCLYSVTKNWFSRFCKWCHCNWQAVWKWWQQVIHWNWMRNKIPHHVLRKRQTERKIHLLCVFRFVLKPVWGLTSFHLFFPALLRHEDPPLPSLVCLFDTLGLEPVSGLVENKPCVFDLGYWMSQLFHSHQEDWANAPGSPSNMARTWPWITTELVGFNLEMLLIQLATLPHVTFFSSTPLIPQKKCKFQKRSADEEISLIM